MNLDGKRILVSGVLNRRSIAYSIAERAMEAGAEVLLTGFGRTRRMTERAAKGLPREVEVLELDVSRPEDFEALTESLRSRWGRVDGAVHAIAFAPEDALGGTFLSAPAESAKSSFEISAFSYKALAQSLMPLWPAVEAAGADRGHGAAGEGDERGDAAPASKAAGGGGAAPAADGAGGGDAPPRAGGSLVGLDFDASVAWPSYDWMGVSKAALEAVNRYLARELGPRGVRSNLISAGPVATAAASGVPGFSELTRIWSETAPLAWDQTDPAPVADSALFLLSDLSRAISGEIIHVDGGFHAVAPCPPSGPPAT